MGGGRSALIRLRDQLWLDDGFDDAPLSEAGAVGKCAIVRGRAAFHDASTTQELAIGGVH
jgi:hypothetical protein